MMRIAGRVLSTLIVLGAFAPAIAADRTATEILKEIDAVKQPQFAPKPGEDRQKAFEAFYAEVKVANEKKAELIDELRKVDPKNEKLVKLLPARWTALAQTGPTDALLAEIDDVIANTKNEALKAEGLYIKARLAMMKDRAHPEAALPAIEAFAKAAPKDRRAPSLLYSMASSIGDESRKIAIEDRILKDFGDTQYADMIKGARRQREQVGKPFALEFTDAIKETPVSMKGLKGKVVVIDFWATWCGPCVAEMPTMKRLYAEYKDQGVEFIGVSLDQPKEQGGLDKLKEFVKAQEITWPQYYQGQGWNSEFSKGWGINAIPCVFIVDADGNLASVEARGKLESMIPELLKKSKTTAGAGGQ